MSFHWPKKLVRGTFAFFFLVSNLGRLGFSVSVRDQSQLEISLPPHLGRVHQSYYPTADEPTPFVIHLQVAHAHYETSLQTKEIIRLLRARYGIDTIFVEGASQTLNASFLQFSKDPASNLKMADALAQKGILTGVELALLEPNPPASGKRLDAIGIEESHLYRAAYQSFKKVVEKSDQTQSALDEEKMKLDTQASKVFSPGLREVTSIWWKFYTGRRDLIATWKCLRKESKKSMNLDFTSPFSQFEWPELTRFALFEEMAGNLDRERFRREKRRLIRWIRREKLPLHLAAGNTPPPSNLSRKFLEDFFREARPRGFQSQDYPHFHEFLASQVIQSELDAHKLFSEFHRLFEAILEQKAVREEEKRLLESYHQLLLLRKLTRLELTREEWEQVKANDLWRLANRETTHQVFILPFDLRRALSASLRFYHLAERRESAFLRKIQQEMKSRHIQKAILVTGGFHSRGLAELFKKDKVGFVLISPRITEEVDPSIYYEVMLGRAQLEKSYLTQSAKTISQDLGEGSLGYLLSENRQVEAVSQHLAGRIDLSFPYFLDRHIFLSRLARMRLKGRSESQAASLWRGEGLQSTALHFDPKLQTANSKLSLEAPQLEKIQHEFIRVSTANLSEVFSGHKAVLLKLAEEWMGPWASEAVTAIEGVHGIGGKDWDPLQERRFENFLRVSLGTVLAPASTAAQILTDTSRDGVGILPAMKKITLQTPIILQVDLKAIDPRDEPERPTVREGLRSRLAGLAPGSVVIAYADATDSESSDLLSDLMREFPRVHFERKTYLSKLDLREVSKARDLWSKLLAIAPEHSGFLFSNFDSLKFKENIQKLGLVFQFDLKSIPNQYRGLQGQLGPAVFGELLEHARLDEEARKRKLRENRARGLFQFTAGSYSFLESWFEVRTRELISASA